MPTPNRAVKLDPVETPADLPMPNLERKQQLISMCMGIWPDWNNLKRRVDRTDRLDAHLNGKYDIVYTVMDSYLKELFEHNVILELENGNPEA
jgi:hypothetical protein